MTVPKQVLYNTLEQILSTDMSRTGALAGKAAMDVALFMAASFQLAVPRQCTLRGLDANGGIGLSVDVDPGEVVFFNGAAGVDSSQYQLARNAVAQNLVVAAADPGNPRVDVVHGTPISTDSDSTIRNVLALPSRVVTPTLIFKTRDADVTLAVTTGVAAASPLTPAIPAGAIPLWYVFVPAAFAGPITDDELADGRIQFNPAAWAANHGRVDGLYPTPVGLTTNITFRTGAAAMNGALGQLTDDVTLDANDLFAAAGGGPVAGDTEYHLYTVIKGGPSYPVAKTLEMIFGVRTDAPDPDGRPSGFLYSYRPLQGIHDEWVHTTQPQALYLGSLMSTAAAVWQIGGDSLAQNKDGSQKQAVFTGTTPGLAGGVNGFTRKPNLTWIDADTVRLEEGGPLITGIPGFHFSLTATMPASLVSGDAELPDTFYFVYLRNAVPGTTPVAGGTVRNYVLVISLEFPNVRMQKPTPEAGGFTVQDYLFVGSFYNNSAQDIEPFERVGGDLVFFRDPFFLHGADVAISPSFTVINGAVPRTSRGIIVSFEGLAEAAGASTAISTVVDIFAGTTSTVGFLRLRLSQVLASGFVLNDFIVDGIGQAIVPTEPVSGDFRVNRNTGLNINSVDVNIKQLGYVENIEIMPQ